MSIQEAYSIFRMGNFQVNRRYQRKLVWLPEEKEVLIDSILAGYPIPLILLAFHTERSSGAKTFEILDGMQRLNAIFAFIENEFSWEGKFFDVGENSRAKQLADENKFTQRKPLLPKPLCARFLEYTLAVTEFPAVNEEAVNQVFGRINSYGRQLSDQEKRQAGVVSLFATVVREIAADIRGDVSQETLNLADMPQISITTPSTELSYGITATETFWCKQGVLRTNQLRDSEDEQMIADIVISVLEKTPFAFIGIALDECYRADSERATILNELLALYGATNLKHHIVSTISIIRTTVESVDLGPRALAKIVHPTSGSNPIKTAFYAIFMAFFELCVRRRKSPGEPRKVMKALGDLQQRLKIAAGQISSDNRQGNVSSTIGLIQSHFVDADPPAYLHSAGAALDFENALRRSRTESARYECKQGLLSLRGARVINVGLLDRLVNTICGIANIGPDSEGAIFLGVADSIQDRKLVEEVDAISAYQVGARHVVGIDREAKALGESIDSYKRRVVAHIRSSKLSIPLRQSVLGKIDCITYREREILCIWIPPQSGMSHVGDNANANVKVYVRQDSNTVEETNPLAVVDVASRFKDGIGRRGRSARVELDEKVPVREKASAGVADAKKAAASKTSDKASSRKKSSAKKSVTKKRK